MTPIRILLVNNLTPEFSVLQILSVQILHELSDTQVVISSAVSSFTQPRTMDPSENAREKMKVHTLEVSRTVNKEDQKHLRSFIVKHPRSLYRYGSPPQDTTYSYESPRLTQFLLFLLLHRTQNWYWTFLMLHAFPLHISQSSVLLHQFGSCRTSRVHPRRAKPVSRIKNYNFLSKTITCISKKWEKWNVHSPEL